MNRRSSDNVTFERVLADLGQYLEHEKEEGLRAVEVSPATVKELGEISAGGDDAESRLNKIAETVRACRKCELHGTRTRAVPGQGCSNPEIMFIGEAPGYDEDREGLAFIGAAGQLLTRMIKAMGLTREEVFIGNVLKCRPPGNRTPLPDEMAVCMPYLRAQIDLLKPRVIVALGATAAKALLGADTGIVRLRGKWMSFDGIDTMPTYHPAYLLRNQSAKKEAWADLQEVLARIGREPPGH